MITNFLQVISAPGLPHDGRHAAEESYATGLDRTLS